MTITNLAFQIFSSAEQLTHMVLDQLSYRKFTYLGTNTAQSQIFFLFNNTPIVFKTRSQNIAINNINDYKQIPEDYYKPKLIYLLIAHLVLVCLAYAIFIVYHHQINGLKNNIFSIFSYVGTDCINLQIRHCMHFKKLLNAHQFDIDKYFDALIARQRDLDEQEMNYINQVQYEKMQELQQKKFEDPSIRNIKLADARNAKSNLENSVHDTGADPYAKTE